MMSVGLFEPRSRLKDATDEALNVGPLGVDLNRGLFFAIASSSSSSVTRLIISEILGTVSLLGMTLWLLSA